MGMKNRFISQNIHVRYTFIYPHEWLFFMVNYIVGKYTIVPWIAWVSQEKHLTEQKDITTEASKRPSSGERLTAQFVRRPGFEFKEWIVEDLVFFPTCQVRVVRFYMSLDLLLLLILRLLLRLVLRGCVVSVPRRTSCEASVPRRTSTAIL